jgi:hypothetical protein
MHPSYTSWISQFDILFGDFVFVYEEHWSFKNEYLFFSN